MTEPSSKPTKLTQVANRYYEAADGRFTVQAIAPTTIPALQRPNRRKRGSQSRATVLGWKVRYTDGTTREFRTLREVRNEA